MTSGLFLLCALMPLAYSLQGIGKSMVQEHGNYGRIFRISSKGMTVHQHEHTVTHGQVDVGSFVEITEEGGVGDEVVKRHQTSVTCSSAAPCQRDDGVLSSDPNVQSSTYEHCTTDQSESPNGRWCSKITSAGQAHCEKAFTFKDCSKTDGKHTIYFPCAWTNNKCKASGEAFTAPGGVLLADGSKHAEVCVWDRSTSNINGNLKGTAIGGVQNPGETCLVCWTPSPSPTPTPTPSPSPTEIPPPSPAPTPTPTPSPAPTPTPSPAPISSGTSPKWFHASDGQSCTSKCQAEGGECSAAGNDQIDTWQKFQHVRDLVTGGANAWWCDSGEHSFIADWGWEDERPVVDEDVGDCFFSTTPVSDCDAAHLWGSRICCCPGNGESYAAVCPVA